MENIVFGDWEKLDLRVAEIKKIEDKENRKFSVSSIFKENIKWKI